MDEKLKRSLDELDEIQTSALLDLDMEYDLDQVTQRRMKDSVHKKIKADKHPGRFLNKRLAGAALVFLIITTGVSIGKDQISDSLKQIMKYIPGYGVNQASDKGDTGEIPQQVLEMVENRRIVNSLTKEGYTIGEKGYRMNYIDFDQLNKGDLSLKKMMRKEEQWLYIIEDKGSSYMSMLIGKHQGKYDVLVYGGGAEMFYHTLSLADPSMTGKADLLAYGGDYYFIDELSRVYQIPKTRAYYEENPVLFDHPISEEIAIEIILANYDDSMKSDDQSLEFCSMGLVEQYSEKVKK